MSDLIVMAEDAAPNKKINSHDIKLGIKHSFGGGYQTFFEVGNDTGTRVRRHADAVAIGIWPSTGHQVHGFEVKVSRTDFLNEMKDPLKSQEIFRFCHRWSLATPPGLVQSDELPPNWGLVTFDGKSLRTVKKAPLLTPEAMTPGFVAALVRRAGEADDAIVAAAQNRTRLEVEARFKEQFDRKLQDHRQSRAQEGEAALGFLEAMKDALGEGYLSAYSVPDIAAAYKLVKDSRLAGRHDSIAKVAEQLEVSAARIRKALTAAVA